MVKPLMEFLEDIPDPRCSRKMVHDHAEMLMLIILGFLAGRMTLRRILRWAKQSETKLKERLKLTGGIPSLPTISRMLSRIDQEEAALVFMDWIGQILNTRGIHIVIDGKGLRAATEKIRDKRTPYILNAIDAATKLVIGQLAIGEKKNEMSEIPKLLGLLDIEGSMLTIDAIGTTTTIMQLIEDKGAYFVFQVKQNNPATYKEIMDLFDHLEAEKREDPETFRQKSEKFYSEFIQNEQNRERNEYRDMRCYTGDKSIGTIRKELPFLKSVARSKQVRIRIEKDRDGNDITPSLAEFLKSGSRSCPNPTEGDQLTDNIQNVGMISNKELQAKDFAVLKREHWLIENSLHNVLDNAFLEDRSTVRNGKAVFSYLRKIAYNVIRLIQIAEKKTEDMVIQILDDVSSGFIPVEKYLFDPIPSFY